VSIDEDVYRQVMGRYPTGVTLVTGMDGEAPQAVVIGSFTSVSVDPPLVGFFTGHQARSWNRMRPSGAFCVNVFADDQADLCGRFFMKDTDPWEGVEWELTATGSPRLLACVASIDCKIHEVIEAGDHLLVLGHVEEVALGREASPMVFLGGSYGKFDQ